MKRYSFDGARPFEDRSFGEWVRFEDTQYEISVFRGAGKVLHDDNERLRDELTAVTLERDALDRKCAALALLLYGPKGD